MSFFCLAGSFILTATEPSKLASIRSTQWRFVGSWRQGWLDFRPPHPASWLAYQTSSGSCCASDSEM